MDKEEIKQDALGWYSSLPYNQWVQLPASGPRPTGRYKHAAAVFGDKLYISGGSRNGRHLSDFQILDLTGFTWSSLKLTTNPSAARLENGNNHEGFPAISGHNMVVWGGKLLVLGGQSKNFSNYATVQCVDLGTQQCSIVHTSGKVPDAREGQSLTLVGSKLIMFGGEDIKRRLLNDVYILDLDSMTWDEVETTQQLPSPRYDHTAALHAERYLLIFGGCSHSACFNDLHLLDLQTMEWSIPEIRGDFVSPRAGHSGVTIDESWFILGGGDNKSGALETLVLDMTKLVWSAVATFNARDPLASEGISVCCLQNSGERFLVAFGGYNGKYNNEVFIMRPKHKNPSRPKIYQSPAAAAAAASVSAAYMIGTGNHSEMIKQGDSQTEEIETKYPQENPTSNIAEFKQEKKLLDSSVAELVEANSTLRGKIDEINSNHAELSKELLSVQAQLAAERSRCFKLEAQIAELQNVLQELPSIEAEVLSLRKQMSALDDDMEPMTTIETQGSRGVWQWLAGGA
ncbi:hypothetical protein V2J09_001440 [Rumex salicifolius]